MPPTALIADEPELAAFLARLPESAALPARTLAHAWIGGGGRIAVGKVAIRLVAGAAAGYTAGAIHAQPPRIELCRVLLEKHGVDADAWMHWSDECADLALRGFDPRARFPSLDIAQVEAAELARLATAVRDLAHMAG